MAMIYVKAKQGRAAYYEGRVIPHDQFIPVNHDHYIERLISHWGDLEAQGNTATPVVPKATKPVERPGPTAQTTPANPAPGTGAPKPIN